MVENLHFYFKHPVLDSYSQKIDTETEKVDNQIAIICK